MGRDGSPSEAQAKLEEIASTFLQRLGTIPEPCCKAFDEGYDDEGSTFCVQWRATNREGLLIVFSDDGEASCSCSGEDLYFSSNIQAFSTDGPIPEKITKWLSEHLA